LSRIGSTTRRAAISGDIVQISGETVIAKVSGEFFEVQSGTGPVLASISGETVISKVSGETLELESGTGPILAKISGETVLTAISGETVIAKVSGETLELQSGTGPIIASISGETVVADVSGQWVIAKVSGETVELQSGTGPILASISGETVVAKVSGEVVDLKVPTAVTSGGIFAVTADSGGAILTSSPCISATIKAMSKNSGDIYLSGKAMQSGEGFVLEPGEAVNLDVDSFGRVRLLAAVSGDRVTYVGVL